MIIFSQVYKLEKLRTWHILLSNSCSYASDSLKAINIQPFLTNHRLRGKSSTLCDIANHLVAICG